MLLPASFKVSQKPIANRFIQGYCRIKSDFETHGQCHHPTLGCDTLQFGFKAKVSTRQCSWLVSEVAAHYVNSGTPVIATLLDCSKAFDKCEFVHLTHPEEVQGEASQL